MDTSRQHRDIQALRSVINEIFVSSTPRADQILFDDNSERNANARRAFKESISGLDRDDVGEKFLIEDRNIYSLSSYASRYAYRYYLPSILLCGLDHMIPADRTLYAVISFLTPAAKYTAPGSQSLFDYQISELSHVEYNAVCEFLRIAFTYAIKYRQKCAQAIRWGWNRYDNLALLIVEDFDNKLYNHTRDYDLMEDNEAVRICLMIEDVFSETPAPGPDQIVDSRQSGEPIEYKRAFSGRQWHGLHPDFLRKNLASLSFFSPEALRYFIPAYLILDLMGNDGMWSTLYTLISIGRSGRDPMLVDYCNKRMSLFSQAEKRCIVVYLRHIQKSDPYEENDIQNALDCFWLKG